MPDLPLTATPALRALSLLRNAIPLAGVFWLGWSPLQYALLFLADACLRPAALGGARLLRDFAWLSQTATPGWAERLDAMVTIGGACLFLAALLFAVFGVPLFALVLSTEDGVASLRNAGFAWGALLVLVFAALQAVVDARRLAASSGEAGQQQRRFATAMALLLGTYLCAFVAILLGGLAWQVLAVLLAILLTVVDWHPDLGERLWPQRARAATPPGPADAGCSGPKTNGAGTPKRTDPVGFRARKRARKR